MRRVLLLILVCGCGGTTIDTGGYDRKCSVDPDCAPVFQGDACNVCGCPNAAVSQAALAKYQQDLATLRARCGPMPAIACEPCPKRLGLCTGGLCTSRLE